MSHTIGSRRGRLPGGPQPRAALDADAVRAAYRRWAGVYDSVFGGVRRWAAVVLPTRSTLAGPPGAGGRRGYRAGAAALPGGQAHHRDRPVGGDARARASRVGELALPNVEALHEMDAEATDFADGAFDIAVAMFVASVVPNPRRLMAEMRRVVRPGGQILFVNHFARETRAALVGGTGAWRRPRAGWAGIRISRWRRCSPPRSCGAIEACPVPPFGIFTLVRLRTIEQ